MNALVRALDAERLKLRGTLAAWTCVIAPVTVVTLYVLQLGVSRIPAGHVADPVQAWRMYSQSVLALWLFLMLPLLITLQAALLAGLEHADRHWKHLLALPLPRGVHYLAKLLVLAAMVLAGFLALLVLLPLGGMVLMLVKPALGLAGLPDVAALLRLAAQAFAASLLMVAVHTWVSIRWRSFTVAVSVGMAATVAGFLIGQSERYGHWYPWSMPVQVMAGNGMHAHFVVVAGLLGGLAVALAGLADFSRREFD
jgi:lantibiotic transport system permease protein